MADAGVIGDLETVNLIAETLIGGGSVPERLEAALATLVTEMGMRTGWISLLEPDELDAEGLQLFKLAAAYNLPPALSHPDVWVPRCRCQELCLAGQLTQAYNEVQCSRLRSAPGERWNLAVHATAPLRAGGKVVGVLNVAARDWATLTPRALALLTNAGTQIGIALERERLYSLLQEQRVLEQAVLLQLSSELLGRPDIKSMMGFLVDKVREVMPVDASALLLPEPGTGLLAFRAASGWQDDPVQLDRKVPADGSSGPGKAMLTQKPVMAEDILENDVAPFMPEWLRREGFRGHAVVPLVADNRSIGTLVINSRNPYHLDQDSLRLLQLLANQAASAIDRARLTEAEIQRQRLEEELAVGRRIQQSLLPEGLPEAPGWDFAAIYRAARQVGGDFYDFFRLPTGPDHLGIVIGDVAGKGVPAGLFMAMSRTMIRTTALSGRSPAKALLRANELILKDSRAELFLSVFYATVDASGGHVVFANAGHNPPLWMRSDGEIIPLTSQGTILGAIEEIDVEEQSITMSPGDVLVLYTDGVSEATNLENEQFEVERLHSVVASHCGQPAEEILLAVVEAVEAFSVGANQSDDLTIMVVRRLP